MSFYHIFTTNYNNTVIIGENQVKNTVWIIKNHLGRLSLSLLLLASFIASSKLVASFSKFEANFSKLVKGFTRLLQGFLG